jgi:hypothetical protein
MVNTRAKGNRIVRKVKDIFTNNGYLVDVVEKTGKFIKQKDLFGLYDIICISPHKFYLIQVTTNRPHPHKPYIQFQKKYNKTGLKTEQWVWYDRKGFKVFTYNTKTYKSKWLK